MLVVLLFRIRFQVEVDEPQTRSSPLDAGWMLSVEGEGEIA